MLARAAALRRAGVTLDARDDAWRPAQRHTLDEAGAGVGDDAGSVVLGGDLASLLPVAVGDVLRLDRRLLRAKYGSSDAVFSAVATMTREQTACEVDYMSRVNRSLRAALRRLLDLQFDNNFLVAVRARKRELQLAATVGDRASSVSLPPIDSDRLARHRQLVKHTDDVSKKVVVVMEHLKHLHTVNTSLREQVARLGDSEAVARDLRRLDKHVRVLEYRIEKLSEENGRLRARTGPRTRAPSAAEAAAREVKLRAALARAESALETTASGSEAAEARAAESAEALRVAGREQRELRHTLDLCKRGGAHLSGVGERRRAAREAAEAARKELAAREQYYTHTLAQVSEEEREVGGELRLCRAELVGAEQRLAGLEAELQRMAAEREAWAAMREAYAAEGGTGGGGLLESAETLGSLPGSVSSEGRPAGVRRAPTTREVLALTAREEHQAGGAAAIAAATGTGGEAGARLRGASLTAARRRAEGSRLKRVMTMWGVEGTGGTGTSSHASHTSLVDLVSGGGRGGGAKGAGRLAAAARTTAAARGGGAAIQEGEEEDDGDAGGAKAAGGGGGADDGGAPAAGGAADGGPVGVPVPITARAPAPAVIRTASLRRQASMASAGESGGASSSASAAAEVWRAVVTLVCVSESTGAEEERVVVVEGTSRSDVEVQARRLQDDFARQEGPRARRGAVRVVKGTAGVAGGALAATAGAKLRVVQKQRTKKKKRKKKVRGVVTLRSLRADGSVAEEKVVVVGATREEVREKAQALQTAHTLREQRARQGEAALQGEVVAGGPVGGGAGEGQGEGGGAGAASGGGGVAMGRGAEGGGGGGAAQGGEGGRAALGDGAGQLRYASLASVGSFWSESMSGGSMLAPATAGGVVHALPVPGVEGGAAGGSAAGSQASGTVTTTRVESDGSRVRRHVTVRGATSEEVQAKMEAVQRGEDVDGAEVVEEREEAAP